jgi:TRAP-type mannitol/chloroaromatic compound transport system permease small subunit
MTQPPPVVFLLDVAYTLLDNDRITADLMRHHSSVRGRAPRALRYDLAATIKAV